MPSAVELGRSGKLLLAAAAASLLVPAAADARFEDRRCTPPSGHRIADCRVGEHGTPDLSRAAWRALRGAEVTISERIFNLAPNPAAGGARNWPLIDSLGRPMGRLHYAARRFTLHALDGTPFRASSARIRGRGCAARLDQQRGHTLVQIIAPRAPASGTQAFLDSAALNRDSATGRAALRAFRAQRGGGTGCGPVDQFGVCDPNSDGTLTWRYWQIPTGIRNHPRLYGWIPTPCPQRMRR